MLTDFRAHGLKLPWSSAMPLVGTECVALSDGCDFGVSCVEWDQACADSAAAGLGGKKA